MKHKPNQLMHRDHIFSLGDKVSYNGKVYDFGYYSRNINISVIYDVGKRDIFSAHSVSTYYLKPI